MDDRRVAKDRIEVTPAMIEAGVAAFREWQTELIRPVGMDRPHQLALKVIQAILPLLPSHSR
jgi:hypothetical protein